MIIVDAITYFPAIMTLNQELPRLIPAEISINGLFVKSGSRFLNLLSAYDMISSHVIAVMQGQYV
jgi:hypothetical protein